MAATRPAISADCTSPAVIKSANDVFDCSNYTGPAGNPGAFSSPGLCFNQEKTIEPQISQMLADEEIQSEQAASNRMSDFPKICIASAKSAVQNVFVE